MERLSSSQFADRDRSFLSSGVRCPTFDKGLLLGLKGFENLPIGHIEVSCITSHVNPQPQRVKCGSIRRFERPRFVDCKRSPATFLSIDPRARSSPSVSMPIMIFGGDRSVMNDRFNSSNEGI